MESNAGSAEELIRHLSILGWIKKAASFVVLCCFTIFN